MKELGIRVALGARRTQVMNAAVGRPMALLAAGSLLGLLAGILASRLLEHIVYQANPSDPAVVGGAVLTMVLLGSLVALGSASHLVGLSPWSGFPWLVLVSLVGFVTYVAIAVTAARLYGWIGNAVKAGAAG